MNNYTNYYHTNNDTRVNQKEVENIDKDHDLSREIRKLRDMRLKGIPIVIGALAARFGDIGIEPRITELKKIVILHSVRILRKALKT